MKEKIIALVRNDMFLALLFIFLAGYNFNLAMIATNMGKYTECIVAAFFSIFNFVSGYIFYSNFKEEGRSEN